MDVAESLWLCLPIMLFTIINLLKVLELAHILSVPVALSSFRSIGTDKLPPSDPGQASQFKCHSPFYFSCPNFSVPLTPQTSLDNAFRISLFLVGQPVYHAG